MVSMLWQLLDRRRSLGWGRFVLKLMLEDRRASSPLFLRFRVCINLRALAGGEGNSSIIETSHACRKLKTEIPVVSWWLGLIVVVVVGDPINLKLTVRDPIPPLIVMPSSSAGSKSLNIILGLYSVVSMAPCVSLAKVQLLGASESESPKMSSCSSSSMTF